MGIAQGSTPVDASPARALEVWCDLDRWPAFVESFRRVVEADRGWPGQGAQVVWETGPHGRGRVTERVESREGEEEGRARFVTSVSEEALTGTQAVAFTVRPEGGSLAEIALDYRLRGGGRLSRLTDALFIRRALHHSLGRTLERFASEVGEAGASEP
ncbi:MAG TPA: SRPBCC family protein [Thermoleophilaceae bacterium]|nr:SRPBCC family protein [Thermoleophilaceae bacterium]